MRNAPRPGIVGRRWAIALAVPRLAATALLIGLLSFALTVPAMAQQKAPVEGFGDLVAKIAPAVEKGLREIEARLSFLLNVGLDYLTLDRSAQTLSGGEGQRIRLASRMIETNTQAIIGEHRLAKQSIGQRRGNGGTIIGHAQGHPIERHADRQPARVGPRPAVQRAGLH